MRAPINLAKHSLLLVITAGIRHQVFTIRHLIHFMLFVTGLAGILDGCKCLFEVNAIRARLFIHLVFDVVIDMTWMYPNWYCK